MGRRPAVDWSALLALAMLAFNGGLASCGGNSTHGTALGTVGGTSSAGGAGVQAGRGGHALDGGAPGTAGSSGAVSGGAVGGWQGLAGKTTADGGEDGNEGGSGGAVACQDLCMADTPECCGPALRCVEVVPTCRIDVLAATINVIGSYRELEAQVATLPPDLLVSITDADIAWAGADPVASLRFELRLDAAASTLHADALSEVDFMHPFLLSCSDRRLFVGVGYPRQSAQAFQTPVLHVEQAADGAVTLLLGTHNGVWYGFGDPDDPAVRERIDQPELRAALCARGILDQL
jgi:hypothetical protein